MEGSVSSSINSRASAIKAILLAAWRGKLSNDEWENRIRKVLPRGVNGDVYDLADCLLKQALVGTVPNQLFISYLQHAINTELVSHGAVLCSIAHQPTNIRPSNSIPNRTASMICLLKFLKTFRDKISCKGTELECLNLCQSLSQLTHWLLKCVLHSLEAIMGSSSLQTPQATTTTLTQTSTAATTTTAQTNINYNISGSSNTTTNTINNNNNNTINNSIANSNFANHNNGSAGQAINLAQNEPIIGIIDLCTEAIDYFTTRPFTKSLLFISKIEFVKEFDEILRTVQQIQQKFHHCPNLQSIQDKIQNHLKALGDINVIFNSHDMHPSVVAAQQLRCLQLHRIRSTQITSGNNFEKQFQQTTAIQDSRTNHALFNSLYPLIAFDVVLRPARSHKLLARQIAIVTNFNSAPVSMAYCELIRVCMIGLIDAEGTPFKVKWAFFTFLKMPKLLIELSKVINKSLTSSDPESTNLADSFASNHTLIFINDLKLAFERLCEYSPLLDQAEHICHCEFFKCLVKELIKNDPGLIQLKNLDIRIFPPKRDAKPNNDKGGHILVKTEPLVRSMLETLESTQDPVELFGIISQLVSGKQFEFALGAAASSGGLQIFVRKLVEHNELNRMTKSGLAKESLVQALIFDVTFLILTYIAQQYGPEVIGKNQNSTFHKWYYDCYHPGTRFNCPKEMIKDCDAEVVDNLLRQILRPDGVIQMNPKDWRQIVFCVPRVMHEILVAWNQGQLSDDDVRLAIERIKSKMCLMAVTAATWLRCYINTINDTIKPKPLSLLQSLTKASHQAKLQKQPSESGLKSEGYSERSSLMCSIVRKILFEIAPKTSPASTSSSSSNSGNNSSNLSGGNSSSNSSIAVSAANDSDESLDESSYLSINDRFISTLSSEEIFIANVKQCLARGWIDYKSLNSLNSLFKMVGSECFTNLIVEQILTSQESPSDISRAVNITYGLFHMDIEACAFALLKDTIPSWLMGEKKQALLNQPRAFALAHLAVMTIVEVYNNLKTSIRLDSTDDRRQLPAINGIKQEPGTQQREPSDLNLINGPDSKRIKLTTVNETVTASKDSQPKSVSERLDKLNECVVDLMRLFREIMSDPVMSQRTLFPVLFLQQTVICTRENSSLITAHLQPEIVLDIIKLFSSELTFELVLAISNLSTSVSRRFAAKAMCQLAQAQESKQSQVQSSSSSTNQLAVGKSACQTAANPLATGPTSNQKSTTAGSTNSITDHVPMIIG